MVSLQFYPASSSSAAWHASTDDDEYFDRQHRKFMAQYLVVAPRRMQTEKILILLIESGCIYLVLYVSLSYLPLIHPLTWLLT
jgi:hypothetical protein